jgi:hypothetical protein
MWSKKRQIAYAWLKLRVILLRRREQCSFTLFIQAVLLGKLFLLPSRNTGGNDKLHHFSRGDIHWSNLFAGHDIQFA